MVCGVPAEPPSTKYTSHRPHHCSGHFVVLDSCLAMQAMSFECHRYLTVLWRQRAPFDLVVWHWLLVETSRARDGTLQVAPLIAAVACSSQLVWLGNWPASPAASARLLPCARGLVEADPKEVQFEGDRSGKGGFSYQTIYGKFPRTYIKTRFNVQLLVEKRKW